MSEFFIYQLIIVFFVIASAFFSSIETAIISTRRISIETLSKRGDRRAIRSLKILNEIEDAIGMVLIGNNISNIAATAFITYVVTKVYFYNDTQLLFVTIIQTMIFLLFCEITPKLVSKANSESILMFFSMPILILMIFFKPLIKLALFFSETITRFFNIQPGEISPIKSRDDIATFISIGRKEGIIDEEKNIYLSEILSFKNAHAYEIMIPAVDIISVNINDSYKNIIAMIEKTGFSRLPVYMTKDDNFIGYIYYRDLLKNPGSKIDDILIEPAFIPETKNVFDIYNKMQKERIPLLFVIDEYGNTSGMLTFEDIAEEIVGEIQTDDHPTEKIITKLTEKKYLLSGRLDIDYFQRYFNIEVNKRHFETLGGFIMSLSGDIPVKGDHIKFKEYEFVIEETGIRTIEKVYFVLPGNKK
jgi:putative hemolysin